MAGCFKHFNETSSSTECCESLDYLRNNQIIKQDSAAPIKYTIRPVSLKMKM